MTAPNKEKMGMNIHFTILEGAKTVVFIILFLPYFKLTFRSAVSAGLRISLPGESLFCFINCWNVNLQTATITATIIKLILLMSDFDANFKEKHLSSYANYLEINLSLTDGLTTFNRLPPSPRPTRQLCVCGHVCVCACESCLFGFLCRYVGSCVAECQWQGCSARYENSHPDRLGLGVRVSHVKTRTGWVCNESEERSWCHTASSGPKRQRPAPSPVWKLMKTMKIWFISINLSQKEKLFSQIFGVFFVIY